MILDEPDLKPGSRRGGFQAVVDLYKKDIDRTSLRENLKLRVEQRFQKFKRMMQLHDELRRAGKALRDQDDG
jgi:hypothetical protein